MSLDQTAAGASGREPATKTSFPRYLALGFQLGLFLILVYRFNIDSRAFLHVGILAFFGFAVHYLLPFRFRLPFFLFLSLISIELVLGFQGERWSLPGLVQGAWIIGIGLALIGLAHLPIAFSIRVGLVAAVAVVLAFLRASDLALPWSTSIWPILASMFMFRLIVYMYDLRHEKSPASWSTRLSYFFMLPNVCFPLYPVVDYQAFRRTYYDKADRHQIYQVGVKWMVRGVVHLLLYRLVYQNLVLDADDVKTAGDLLQYLFWPFLLYLRVSGYFHIIVGMLHLFGFNLAETHHLYYLASSFTDFWRRINIPWKDFMMKIFYYPVYLRIKSWGSTTALVVTTLFVFLMTWILHAYQWFWIRGTFLLTWNDGLFWAALGLLVVGASLYEVKYGRKRRLAGSSMSWREAMPIALGAIVVYCTISLLWSFWSAHSVGEWLSAWRALGHWELSDLPAVVIGLAVLTAIGVGSAMDARGVIERPFSFSRSFAGVVAGAAILLGMTLPVVTEGLSPRGREIVTDLRASELNSRDFEKLERGYYENLIDVGSFNPELWEVYRTRPADWRNLRDTDAVFYTDGFPWYELRPDSETRHNGALVRTNRWGMRDRDYEKVPAEGVTRIAIVGSSFVFGSGVENEEIFESLLETRLNSSRSSSEVAYEVLNFGVAGYAPLEHLEVIKERALEFEPEVLLYVEHADSGNNVVIQLVATMQRGIRPAYDYLDDIIARAGIDETTIDQSSDPNVLKAKLGPYQEELLAGLYQRMVEACREDGVTPVWVYLPRPEETERGGPPEPETRLAREAGFELLDLTGVYGEGDLGELWIARWDHHPNAEGHRRIAEGLYRMLEERELLDSVEQ